MGLKEIYKYYATPLLWAVLFVKVSLVFFLDYSPKVFEDFDMAQNLVNDGELFYFNDGVKNHSFQFPIYPLIISSFIYLGLSVKWILAFNVLFISLSAFLLRSFADKFFTRKGIDMSKYLLDILTLVILVYPVTNIYAYGALHPFSFNLFLLSCFFLIAEKYIQKDVKWYSLAIMFSIVLLQRSSLFPLMLYPFIEKYADLKEEWKTWIKIAFVSLILPLLWMNRNYHKDEVFAMTSTSGKILWKGTVLESDGSNYGEGEKNYYFYLPDSVKNQLASLSVKEQNHVFLEMHESNWKNGFSKQLGHYFKKIKSFLWFRDNLGIEYKGYEKYIVAYQFFYVFLICSVLLTIITRFRQVVPLLIPFLILALFQAYFYVEMRHRIIYEPVLMLVALMSSNIMIQIRRRKV